MMTDENGKHGILTRHCPKLGHSILFSYCVKADMTESGASHPCKKIIDCWWETFDVQSFLKDMLTVAEYKALLCKEPGNCRTESLFDAIQRAVKNKL